MTTLAQAEARFEASVAALKQARADFGRSRSQKRLTAFHLAEAECDAATAAFRAAQDAAEKQHRAEARAARLAARPENRQMEMFA